MKLKKSGKRIPLSLCLVFLGGIACDLGAGTVVGGEGASSGGKNACSIEDADDGDDQTVVRDGRGGYIYTYVDSSGSSLSPPPNGFKAASGGAQNTSGALRFEGQLASSGEVYAGVGFSFTEPKSIHDISRYSGLSFMAKHGPDSTTNVRLKLPDINTDPDGKQCTEECYNDFGVDFSVTSEWTRYTINFADLRQEEGWGQPRPPGLDITKVYGIQWQVVSPGAKYDIWIDEIEFLGCE